MSWNRICCPVDFSKTSEEALAVASKLAAAVDAELVLLHVYQVPVFALTEGSLVPTPQMLEERSRRADKQLAACAAEARKLGARRVTTTKIVGAPRQEVALYVASTKVDLVVMGTEGRTGVRHALAGSVAERVVQHAVCPVLVIPRKATVTAEEGDEASSREDEETDVTETKSHDTNDADQNPIEALAGTLLGESAEEERSNAWWSLSLLYA